MLISGSTATHPSVLPTISRVRRALLASFLCAAFWAALLRRGRGRRGRRRRRCARPTRSGAGAASAGARELPLAGAAGRVHGHRRPTWRRSRALPGPSACSWAPAAGPRCPRSPRRSSGSARAREVLRLSGDLAATAPSGTALARALGRGPARGLRGARPRGCAWPPTRSTRSTSRPAAPASSTRGPTTRWAPRRRWPPPAAARACGSRWWTPAWTWPTPSLPGASPAPTTSISKAPGVTDRVGPRHVRVGPDRRDRRQRHRRQGRGRQHADPRGARLAERRARPCGRIALAIEASVRRGARIINMSLAGPSFSVSQLRALQTRLLQRRASGGRVRQQRAERKPARVPRRGARRRARPARDRPVGDRHRGRVGAGRASRPTTTTSASPRPEPARPVASSACSRSSRPTGASDWDDPSSCSLLFSQGGVRFAYGEGTSFAAPLVSGIAALVWEVQPRLSSEQVAHVLTRSARQTVGRGWNERTGAGVVDGGAATALARIYDVTPPPRRGSARRRDGTHVAVRMGRARDRTRAEPRAGRAPHLRDPRLARRRRQLPRGPAAALAVPARREPQGPARERARHRGLRPQRQLRGQAARPLQGVLARGRRLEAEARQVRRDPPIRRADDVVRLRSTLPIVA